MGTTPTELKHRSIRRLAWQIPLGLVISTGAFVFGAFVAIPAALAVVPGLRRFWPLGVALFLGVIGVRGLDLAGVNPVLAHARSSIIADLEAALGGEVHCDSFSGEVPAGRLLLRGVRADLPALGGHVTVDEIAVDAGFALWFRPEGYSVTLSGLSAEFDPSGGRLEQFLEGLEVSGDSRANVFMSGGRVSLLGEDTSAVAYLGEVRGEFDTDGWVVDIGVQRVDLDVLGQSHTLAVQGGLSVRGGDSLSVRVAAGVHEPDLGRMVLNGALQPGMDGRIRCTIDRLALHPLWERYRKIDEYHGRLRGDVWITGDLSALALELDLFVEDYGYYHRTFMGLDRERTFHVPEASITGGISIHEGERWEFRDVTVDAASATLATGPYITANGGGRLVLRGEIPRLEGELDARVTDGRIGRAISWSPVATAGLGDLKPNLVQVGEQFEDLELDWTLDIQGLVVDSDPLSGVLAGRLEGVYLKAPGENARIRADGELQLNEGSFAFCAASGNVTGRVIFQENLPTEWALIRGGLTGKAGDTPLSADITGSLSKPVIAFREMTMGPAELGQQIFGGGDPSAEERARRREELVRLCGPAAARDDNPFEARHSGKVIFDFED